MTYALFVYDRPDSLAGLGEDARQAIFSAYEALQTVPGLAGRRLTPTSSAVVDDLHAESAREACAAFLH